MKNLMIFVNPARTFVDPHWGNENEILAKIQIENSLALGWKKEDIMIVTNFDFEHMGVKSIKVDDDLFCEASHTATKIKVILYLIDQGIIKEKLCWFHDFDAFQLEKITEKELDLKDKIFALTDYGKTVINEFRDRRWSTGTIFFKKEARDIFELILNYVYRYKANEEVILLLLTNQNKNKINSKIKKLNITYNLATRKRDVSACYDMANKPVRVIHFHPSDKRVVDSELGGDNIDVCIHGKNRRNVILFNDRLTKLFKKYNILA